MFSVLCKFFVGERGGGYEHLVVVVVSNVIVCVGYHYTLLIMAQNVMGTEFWVGWIFFLFNFFKNLKYLPLHCVDSQYIHSCPFNHIKGRIGSQWSL